MNMQLHSSFGIAKPVSMSKRSVRARDMAAPPVTAPPKVFECLLFINILAQLCPQHARAGTHSRITHTHTHTHTHTRTHTRTHTHAHTHTHTRSLSQARRNTAQRDTLNGTNTGT